MGVFWSILVVVLFIVGVIFVWQLCCLSGEADKREEEMLRKMAKERTQRGEK